MSRRPNRETSTVLGDDQVNEFKEAFELFDANKSGFITKDGLKNVLKQFGIRVEEGSFDEMFKEGDSSGQGKIAFPEFMSMMQKRMKQTSNEEILRGAFRSFDPDGLGYVPTPYLRDCLTTMGDKLTKAEFQELQSVAENEKQEIRYDLFVGLMFAKK
eukprot:TRINITY_DN733_c0_g1_i1.p1 TRINITY_DN733_c0_g1~~TRINITY_DN733_c0_g1_i1.p1  ORF type:complete len:158 (-),score=48.33 TRINITY_DN733_c0_g1_i1:147-620(-)